jgi:RNA polymerase sigma-70 factor (ECF subfamily)
MHRLLNSKFGVCEALVTPSENESTESGSNPETATGSERLSTERLVEKCQAGSSEAFGSLVAAYEERIFNFLFRLAGNRHDAEDLTQETFLKVYQSIQRLDSTRAFSTWVFTIAKRTAYNHFRGAKKFEELPPDTEVDSDDPSILLEQKDEQISVWKVAEGLPRDQYEALWLRYGEGFSIAETATILHTNQIRVRVLLHRARKILAKRLRPGNFQKLS